MGNWINYASARGNGRIETDMPIEKIPNHLLIDIISDLAESDVGAFRSVCRRWNWLVSVAPIDRLPKLHVARLGVDCKFEGNDVVWVRQRNSTTTDPIRGVTRENTLKKLRRLSCDELRLCGQPINETWWMAASGAASLNALPNGRRGSFGGSGAAEMQVAVNPHFFRTVVESSWRTLTRVYVFRCSLFRFTEKDVSTLAMVEHLILLSICRVSDANAVNDNSLTPIIQRGTLEKLVLDYMTVTDALLRTAAQCCKKLTLLSVWGCEGISENGVAELTNRHTGEGLKIICRGTSFDVNNFLGDSPRFRLSPSGRAVEMPQRKISIHFA